MTQGMKSSEFGMAALVSTIALLNEKLGLGLTPETLQTVAVVVGAYAVSRGVAKRKG